MKPVRVVSLFLATVLVAAPLAACDEQGAAEIDSAGAAAVGDVTPQPETASPTARPSASQTSAPAQAGGQGLARWTVLLYQDADDEVLEEDIFFDLNEAERIGSTDQVTIISQIDRYDGAFEGDGDWTGARRYVLAQDDNLDVIASPVAVDLGEVNMADGDTLVDFIKWGVAHYPAEHYALILSDHGTGWPGGWSDPTAPGSGPSAIPLAESFGDMLFLKELDRSLQRAVDETGIGQFELLGLDACLMAQVEVFSALAPYARYAVASEEVEPALGWAYTAFLGALTAHPEMDGAGLSRAIVESYIGQDQRIVDPQAREAYAGRGVSATQAAQDTAQSVTLSAVDLRKLPAVMAALDDLAIALGDVSPRTVARARTYAQSFESVFGDETPPSYIDLAHFAALAAKEADRPAVTEAAAALQGTLEAALVAQTRGPDRPGAHGMAIYFPNSALYKAADSGPASYSDVAGRFAAGSLWDEFLAAHYSGQTLTRSAPVPTPVPEAEIVAPGAGTLSMDPIRLSAQTASQDHPVVLSTRITGENLGFVYLFVGAYDQARNALKVADQDFIEGDGTREADGVFYPTWDGPDVSVEFEWTPSLYAIDDGSQVVPALLSPETYGATAEQATFAAEGTFVFAGGQRRYAKAIFRGTGELDMILGFTQANGSGSPSEITPAPGDRFILLDTWYDLASGEFSNSEGATLTFSGTPWTYATVPAPAGLYNIGFIAEDLDGNSTEAYVDVRVQ